MKYIRTLSNIKSHTIPTMESFLKGASNRGEYFDSEFVHLNLFLQNITLKDAAEKDTFIRQIIGLVDKLPDDFAKFKILPELIKGLEFGGLGPHALKPIFKLGAKSSDQEFEQILVPLIVKLFASNERAIRVQLCENMPHFVDKLPEKIISDSIFTNLSTGFNDTSAVIREQTLKTILVIMPKVFHLLSYTFRYINLIVERQNRQ